MQAVVLAGGLGTRMIAYTASVPKSLIPVADRPFLDHQMRLLGSGGVDHLVFCLGYKGEMIEREALRLKPEGMKLDFVYDGETPLGTAGALRVALDQGVLAPKFLLTYGDSYLPVDYQAIWQAFLSSESPVLMTVMRNLGKWDRSNAFLDGSRVLYDKNPDSVRKQCMDYIDYGLMCWSRDAVLGQIPPGEKLDLAVVLKTLGESGQLGGYEVRERFYEIGSPEGLGDLESFLRHLGTTNERKPHERHDTRVQN